MRELNGCLPRRLVTPKSNVGGSPGDNRTKAGSSEGFRSATLDSEICSRWRRLRFPRTRKRWRNFSYVRRLNLV
jgi:hypothetical protein